jgi:serine/threonine protein kinase
VPMDERPISAALARRVGSSRRTRLPYSIADTCAVASDVPAGGMVGSRSYTTLEISKAEAARITGGGNGVVAASSEPSITAISGSQRALPRPASAPLIKDVGEPFGSGAQAVVCRATLSSSKQPVALVRGKQPIADSTLGVLYLLAARRPKHVVAVLHPDVTSSVCRPTAPNSIVTMPATRPLAPSHHRECSVAIQACTCSLADLLSSKRYSCTSRGFSEAVQHLVSRAEMEGSDAAVGSSTSSPTAQRQPPSMISSAFAASAEYCGPQPLHDDSFIAVRLDSNLIDVATMSSSATNEREGAFLSCAYSDDVSDTLSPSAVEGLVCSNSNVSDDRYLDAALLPNTSDGIRRVGVRAAACDAPASSHGAPSTNDPALLTSSDRVTITDSDSVSEAFLAGLARHILIGLRGLHDLRLAHNDIKISNILFDEATGTFLLGDLLNASVVVNCDVCPTQPPTPARSPSQPEEEMMTIPAAQCQKRRPPSLFAQAPFRADMRAFALLMLQVSQTIENTSFKDTGDKGDGPQPHHQQQHGTRRMAANAGEALRLAGDGALTGCNDWVPWEDVEALWKASRAVNEFPAGSSPHSPLPSAECVAFVKQAFCGVEDHRLGAHQQVRSHDGAPRDEASALLRHRFLTRYGRSNDQWKQLLKAAFAGSDLQPAPSPQSSFNGQQRFHRRTTSRHGSVPTTPVSSPHPSTSSDAAVYAALFPHHSPTSRVPSSPTLDEMNTLSSSMRGSNSSLCGLFPPTPLPPPVQRSNSHRTPFQFVRQPPGRK